MMNVSAGGRPLQNKKIVIIHGYTATPEKNWFPWLKSQLEVLGASVLVPQMPNSQAPDPECWLQHLRDSQIVLDENTLFIGHSLGCISVLRFLAKQKIQSGKIGGYILVSGFADEQETLPELKSHTDINLDYRYLKEIADIRISIISSNDEIVSPESSKSLAKLLDTEVVTISHAGHFLDREGYVEFPTILELIKEKLIPR